MCVASLQTKIEERSLLFLDASIDSFCKHCLKDGTVSKNKATADESTDELASLLNEALFK